MEPDPFAAIVLAGGSSRRMGGADKAQADLDGRSLLAHVLDALVDAAEVVVVGDAVRTERPVTFVREEPPLGGPAAGLLAGRDALVREVPWVGVAAVDMPRLTPATYARLRAGAVGRDGAFLVDGTGRRQLAGIVSLAALDAAAPPAGQRNGLPVHRLLAALDLADVAAEGDESRDVDTWADLRDLRT